MAVTKTLFKATAGNGGAPGEILARLNAEICRDNESCMFVTFFCAILNIRTGQVDYSNGGSKMPHCRQRTRGGPFEKSRGGGLWGVGPEAPHVRPRGFPPCRRFPLFHPRGSRGHRAVL